MLNEVQEHGNRNITELHIILLGRMMAQRVMEKFVRVERLTGSRAVNRLLSKDLQGHSPGADMARVNLSKPGCSGAPGGL